MGRRMVLRALVSGGLLALTGCIDGTGSCSEIRIWAVDASRTEASGEPMITYPTLTPEEQAIADEVVVGSGYRECHPPSDPLSRFLDRARSAKDTRTYDGDVVYLCIDDECYALVILVGDQYVSHPLVALDAS